MTVELVPGYYPLLLALPGDEVQVGGRWYGVAEVAVCAVAGHDGMCTVVVVEGLAALHRPPDSLLWLRHAAGGGG